MPFDAYMEIEKLILYNVFKYHKHPIISVLQRLNLKTCKSNADTHEQVKQNIYVTQGTYHRVE